MVFREVGARPTSQTSEPKIDEGQSKAAPAFSTT
jgi:hypothetical protein